jgi:hypothetical protein
MKGSGERRVLGGNAGMLRLFRVLIAPERLYMAALGLSGLASLLTIALVPAQRGLLAGTMAGATLGSAIGGISIDTFLMSRPKGWVWGRGTAWLIGLLVPSVLLSGVVAAAIIGFEGFGSYPVGIGAACCLTVFNACSSLALRIQKFQFVYAVRALGALTLLAGYGLFYLDGDDSGLAWSEAYLISQGVAATVLAAMVLRWAARIRPADARRTQLPDRNDRITDLSRMGKLHVGIAASLLTSRLDQILLAHIVGESALGLYALAVAALEFAQAGAVVRSQKILTNQEQAATMPRAWPVVLATAPVAVVSVLGLAALGILRPAYAGAWIIGLLLLPGAVGSALGKTWSAILLIRRGEVATTTVAVLLAALAIPLYFIFVSWLGTYGGAIGVTCIYILYAVGTLIGLRARSGTPLRVGRVI